MAENVEMNKSLVTFTFVFCLIMLGVFLFGFPHASAFLKTIGIVFNALMAAIFLTLFIHDKAKAKKGGE